MIKVSESLNGAVENFLEVTPEVVAHMENRKNPHAVTKEQVGLSKVLNEEQATAAQYNAHISGQVKHSAEDILYDGENLKEKIESLENSSGGGSGEEIEALKAECENLKEKLREFTEDRVVLRGEVITDTFDNTIQLPFEGDERFVDHNGCLAVPERTAAAFDIDVVMIAKENDVILGAQSHHFEGVCMNYDGESYYKLYKEDYSPMYSGELPALEGTGNYYSQIQFMNNHFGWGIFVIGDDKPINWKATVTIKNITEF